jgi:hypothetical protein
MNSAPLQPTMKMPLKLFQILTTRLSSQELLDTLTTANSGTITTNVSSTHHPTANQLDNILSHKMPQLPSRHRQRKLLPGIPTNSMIYLYPGIFCWQAMNYRTSSYRLSKVTKTSLSTTPTTKVQTEPKPMSESNHQHIKMPTKITRSTNKTQQPV